MVSDYGQPFLLLNDLPVDQPSADLLGTSEAADRLAELVHGSRDKTPFVLAIDGGWGTGKSTLMKQLANGLENRGDVEVIWFNAWTANGVDALSGLLKVVLNRLDQNVVRRSFKRLKSAGVLTGTLRVGLAMAAGMVGLDRALDELWGRMTVDAGARQEARALVGHAVTSWVQRGGSRRRTLAIFVDDLDRCGDATAVEICEVIKLYLDLPGVAFILGCDLGVLSRIRLPGAETTVHVRQYLEKIIQVNYQIPVPTEEAVRDMVAGYARMSNTTGLMSESLISLIGHQSEGNPRRVKRLINSFVTEYQLDPQWQEFGAEGLMKAIVLQHFYPEYYKAMLYGEGDVVQDMLDYSRTRVWLREQGQVDGEADLAAGVLRRWMVSPPQGADPKEWLGCLTQLDERVPNLWRSLIDNREFLRLLLEIGDASEHHRLQSRLRRRPLSTAPTLSAQDLSQPSRLDGLRLLWIDDNPAYNEALINELTARGVQVRTAVNGVQAVELVSVFKPNTIISDIGRDGKDVGFEDLEKIRETGWRGTALFFTGYTSPERRKRAHELGADITTSTARVVEWLEEVAHRNTA